MNFSALCGDYAMLQLIRRAFCYEPSFSSDRIAAAMESSSELPTPSLKWFGHRKINLRKAEICLLPSSVSSVLSRPSKKPISEHPIQSHFLCCIAGPLLNVQVRASGPAAPVGKLNRLVSMKA